MFLLAPKSLSEIIVIALPTHPIVLTINLDAAADKYKLFGEIADVFYHTGITPQIDGDTHVGLKLVFSCSENDWRLLRQGVFIEEKGVRLPAG